MNHLLDEPTWAATGPAPMDRLLPTAAAMSALCLLLFAILFVV